MAGTADTDEAGWFMLANGANGVPLLSYRDDVPRDQFRRYLLTIELGGVKSVRDHWALAPVVRVSGLDHPGR